MNHIKPKYSAVIGDKDCVIDNKDIVLNNLPHIYRNVDTVIHELYFNYNEYEKYYVNVYNPCNTGGQHIMVKNRNDVTYKTLTREFPLYVYKELASENLKYVGDSINNFIDVLSISGKSIISPANINHPGGFRSINTFTIETKISSNNNIVNIDLRTKLRSLPNGIKDIFVLDANAKRAYILRKISKEVISGEDEEISYVPTFSTNNYAVFFIKNTRAKFLDDKSAIVSNYFQSASYSDLINKYNDRNIIALSDDYMWRHEGFYIKIDRQIADNVDQFRAFVNKLYKETPLVIMYPLMKSEYEPVLLYTYEIPTYYGGTYIECIEGYDLTYFYKSISL